MKIARIRDVKLPLRATKKSGGLDFYVPNDFPYTVLHPGEDIKIPSGIKAQVPTGYILEAKNKSGVALKARLQVGAAVIDEDYQGELHLHVYNAGLEPTTINPGEKLVQMVLVAVSLEDVIEVTEDTLFTTASERADGGFGSTGLK